MNPGQVPRDDIPKSKHASSAPSEQPSRMHNTWLPTAKCAPVMDKNESVRQSRSSTNESISLPVVRLIFLIARYVPCYGLLPEWTSWLSLGHIAGSATLLLQRRPRTMIPPGAKVSRSGNTGHKVKHWQGSLPNSVVQRHSAGGPDRCSAQTGLSRGVLKCNNQRHQAHHPVGTSQARELIATDSPEFIPWAAKA